MPNIPWKNGGDPVRFDSGTQSQPLKGLSTPQYIPDVQ